MKQWRYKILVKLYYSLIIRGIKTLDNVPTKLKNDVIKLLKENNILKSND